jgi:hypothetical protein
VTGQVNKAWWIAHVKEYGSGGGISYLAEKAGTYYAKAKPAIDLLVNLKLIDMQKTGTTVKYVVTSLGHRYLNENRDELEAADVVAEPEAKSESMTPVAVAQIPHSEVQPQPQPTGSSLGGGFPARSKPAEEPPVQRPDMPDAVLVEAPSDHQALKDALYLILYEKFADQVTAKELMDRLNEAPRD